MTKIKITEADLRNLVNQVLKETIQLKESYEVHYSDGVRAGKKVDDLNSAIQLAKNLTNRPGMKFVDIYHAGSGFHSTADEKYLVKWWGDGSYWDNMSKENPELLDKKLNLIKEEQKLKKYTLTVKHDKGTKKIKTTASSEAEAKKKIMNYEKCPESAIIDCKDSGYVLKEEIELNLIDDNFVGAINISFNEGSQQFDNEMHHNTTIREAQRYAKKKLYNQSRYRKTDETLWATFSTKVNGKWVEDFSKRIKLNSGLKEDINDTEPIQQKFTYSIEEVIELAELAGLTVLDAQDALMELTVAYGEEIPRSRVEEVLREYDMSVEELLGGRDEDGDYFERVLFFGPDILQYVDPVKQLLNDNGISFEIYEDESYDDGSLILEFPSIEEKEKASRLIGQEYRDSHGGSDEIEEL